MTQGYYDQPCKAEAPKPPTFLEELNSRLEQELKGIADTCFRLDDFVHRSLGYSSVFEPTAENKEEVSCHASRASANINRLAYWNEKLSILNQRISELG